MVCQQVINNKKQCSKCKEWKDITNFWKDKRVRTGLKACCKICHYKMNRKWQIKNKHKMREYQKIYKEKHPEKQKEYYQKHKDKRLLKNKIWREKNKDEIKKKSHEYYLLNKERLYQKNREWFNTEKGKLLERKRRAKRRGLRDIEFFPNIFPDGIKIEWHHINDFIIVPLPVETHRQSYTNNLALHRKLAEQWIEYIYGINPIWIMAMSCL
jgi:hypothetical protein